MSKFILTVCILGSSGSGAGDSSLPGVASVVSFVASGSCGEPKHNSHHTLVTCTNLYGITKLIKR